MDGPATYCDGYACGTVQVDPPVCYGTNDDAWDCYIPECKELTGLGGCDFGVVSGTFSGLAEADGTLSREAFMKGMRELSEK